LFSKYGYNKKNVSRQDVAVSSDDAISKLPYKSEGLHLSFFNNNEEEVLFLLKEIKMQNCFDKV
jgi:hypothetical protein